MRTFAVLAAILMSFAGTAASATLIDLTATINGAQANAGAGSGATGTGSGAMTLDTDTNLLNWNISWNGLTGAVTAIHFHGPALPNQNAGVQIALGNISPAISNAVLTDQQETDLLAGLWYINIHTAAFPAGEIRGQVMIDRNDQSDSVPAPAALSVLLFGLGGLAFARRKRSRQD